MSAFPFEVVGFDLDGTLLDTAGDLALAVNHVLALEGREALSLPTVRSFVGGGARRLLTKSFDETGGGIPEARFEALHAEFLAYYEEHIAVETKLFPGGQAMLDRLAARGVKIAVVTNKLERLAVKIFAEMGLSDRFVTVIGGDTLGPGRAKPAPDLLNLMMDLVGTRNVAYVGDTRFDTRAAKAAAIPCVVVSFGFNDCGPTEMEAAAVIDHFDQLIPTLELIGVDV